MKAVLLGGLTCALMSTGCSLLFDVPSSGYTSTSDLESCLEVPAVTPVVDYCIADLDTGLPDSLQPGTERLGVFVSSIPLPNAERPEPDALILGDETGAASNLAGECKEKGTITLELVVSARLDVGAGSSQLLTLSSEGEAVIELSQEDRSLRIGDASVAEPLPFDLVDDPAYLAIVIDGAETLVVYASPGEPPQRASYSGLLDIATWPDFGDGRLDLGAGLYLHSLQIGCRSYTGEGLRARVPRNAREPE